MKGYAVIRNMNLGKQIAGLAFAVILGMCCTKANATTVKGKVTDSLQKPVPYATVYVKGTTHGTTTNDEGNYTLDLEPGAYTLVFRMMGYAAWTTPITVGHEKMIVNAVLHDESLEMKEVTVTNKEDPAYNMIRHAIKMRKHYKDQVNAYNCNVYIKGIQRITKHPKKLLGRDISNDMLGLIDTTSNIIYLSESVSKFNFKQPDNVKEEMISSKVSGNNQAFSYNSASDMLFDFYESVMQIEGLSERGFISPIAPDAMLYYKYHLEGTYQENGSTVDKIQVIARRKNDPVFRGFIYLEESGWRIYATDLYLTKDAQIDFVDTLVIDQSFVPVTNDIWMPFTNKFLFHFGALGFKGSGMYVGVNSDYNIEPVFKKHYFNGEDMKIDTDANKKDTGYWHQTRPVPLTGEEMHDYHERDSIMAIRNSKKYLDSVDKKENKVNFMKVFLGGVGINNRYKKESYGLSPLIQDVQFNTVQGLRLALDGYYSKQLSKNRYYYIDPGINYGLSNHKLNATVNTKYEFRPESFSAIGFGAGRDAVQFNSQKPYSAIFNELYSLLEKENYMKLYQSDFAKFFYTSEIVNGVVLTTSLKYESRYKLFNTSDFSFSKADRDYTSNDPLVFGPEGQPDFVANKALLFDADFKISFKQHYYTRPHEKIIEGTKYPVLNLYYKKGINSILGSNVDYDYLEASLSGRLNLKMAGNSNWKVQAGKFFNNKAMYFMDYYHFDGNQTIFTNSSGFELLPYYKYSTNDQYVMGNYEHHFGGLILNKFPLIRKLKLGEIAGINYLTTNTLHQYVELYAGIEKLRTFEVICAGGIENGAKTYATFRIGISATGIVSTN